MESGFRNILLVYVYSVLGVFLVVAPWTPIWEQASHALLPVSAHRFALSGWVRGVVSGLGAADLVVAARLAGVILRASRN